MTETNSFLSSHTLPSKNEHYWNFVHDLDYEDADKKRHEEGRAYDDEKEGRNSSRRKHNIKRWIGEADKDMKDLCQASSLQYSIDEITGLIEKSGLKYPTTQEHMTAEETFLRQKIDSSAEAHRICYIHPNFEDVSSAEAARKENIVAGRKRYADAYALVPGNTSAHPDTFASRTDKLHSKLTSFLPHKVSRGRRGHSTT